MKHDRGDLIQMALAGRFDVLIHGCNCYNKMKAGIANAIRHAFPEALQADEATAAGDRSKLGTFTAAELVRGRTRLTVVNAYTQFDWRGDGEKVDYDAVAMALRAISQRYRGARFGYPRIGAGLAGGDWDRLRDIIDDALAGEDHTLIEFMPGTFVGDARPRYAGVGSRLTPEIDLDYMRRVAGRLALRGFVLRSGAARGADTAFEEGAVRNGGGTEIWMPDRGFNDHPDTGLYPDEPHFEMAARLHPAWDRLSQNARALHARNIGQVLGADLKSPVRFVICWTADGCESAAGRSRVTGGTGMAIEVADRHGIPVFNLARPDARERLVRHVLHNEIGTTVAATGNRVLDGSNLGASDSDVPRGLQ